MHYLHEPINIVHGTRRVFRQSVIGPDVFAEVSGDGGIEDRQVVHVGIPEEVDDTLESSYLPVDGVSVLLQQFKLHDELMVDGPAAFVLLHRDV